MFAVDRAGAGTGSRPRRTRTAFEPWPPWRRHPAGDWPESLRCISSSDSGRRCRLCWTLKAVCYIAGLRVTAFRTKNELSRAVPVTTKNEQPVTTKNTASKRAGVRPRGASLASGCAPTLAGGGGGAHDDRVAATTRSPAKTPGADPRSPPDCRPGAAARSGAGTRPSLKLRAISSPSRGTQGATAWRRGGPDPPPSRGDVDTRSQGRIVPGLLGESPRA